MKTIEQRIEENNAKLAAVLSQRDELLTEECKIREILNSLMIQEHRLLTGVLS